MKCDRRWWNDGRFELVCAEQRARDEDRRLAEMSTHPRMCWCMLCKPDIKWAAKLFRGEGA